LLHLLELRAVSNDFRRFHRHEFPHVLQYGLFLQYATAYRRLQRRRAASRPSKPDGFA